MIREKLERLRQAVAAELKSCGKDLQRVRRAHAWIRDEELENDVFLGNHLITAYGNCGRFDYAVGVFSALPNPSHFTWNALLVGLAQNGHLDQARRLLDRMPWWHVHACSIISRELAGLCRLEEARELFEAMPEKSSVSWNSLIAAYAQTGHMEESKSLFDRMQSRDVVTWTSMIRGYALNSDVSRAVEWFENIPATNPLPWNTMLTMYAENGDLPRCEILFQLMPEQTAVSHTTMLGVYGQSGLIEPAEKLFERMPEKDIVSWTTMIQVYGSQGHWERAKSVFDTMPVKDTVSWTALLGAFTQAGQVAEAKLLFERMPKLDLVIGNVMLAAYAHNGLVESTRELFNTLRERDLVSWTCLIAAHAQGGEGPVAMELFRDMLAEGIEPDEIVFLSILSTCSHSGLLKDGVASFRSMVSDHGIEPIAEHYSCMVDGLSRCGKLKDAEELTESMPFLPSDLALGSLLASCRDQEEVERGRRVAAGAIEASPGEHTSYLMLANLLTGKPSRRESLAREKSRIVIHGEEYVFGKGSGAFRENKLEILMTLEKIYSLLEEEGYGEFVKRDDDDDDDEVYRSEKLAMALGVVRTKPGTSILIKKSSSLCSECHTLFRLVSRVLQRAIVVEEAHQVHTFRSGECSCER